MEERLHLSTHGVMLTMDAPPRRAVTKTTTTNGAARKPSSSSASSSSPFSFSTSSLNTNSHRVAMHSSHPHPHPHQQQKRYQQPYDFKVHHHHLLSDECPQDAALRKNLPPLQYKVHDSAFCRVLSAETTAVALAAAAICSSDIDRDIWKCGYLRKQKHGHKRFFVLRGPSNLGPSRLEYYDSEKKFRSALKAAASGVVCPAKRVIYLSQCFTVNKRADAKNKYLIALYTKDEYFAVAAESEQEQEDWYFCLTELMTEGKKGQLESDELDDGYGTISPGTIFKEVWQVNVKPKGLGQTKNLMGVYRLCLSAKTIHLVKLNSETPAVNLPLMSIRRCGHSESFFFIEVGRSSSIGPGEIWVQVDDSVVAQNMHETILDTMKALKAFPDFRPRSKSQSSGLNPIPFVTTRRHFCNLPPSQTGLQRPYRTDSVTGMAPTSKSKSRTSQRYRTSSEGEGAQNRPLSSGTGSLVHLITPVLSVGREESGSVCANISPASSHHTRSASLPVSHFLSATSPISVSSSSGHGSASDTHTRPSSSSICGSPSDGGFNSSDEFCPSPCDFRYFHASCTTPDSHSSTPPVREDYRLTEYMAMDWHKDGIRTFEEESGYMERTFLKLAHSSKPSMASSLGFMQQKATQTSSSLDEPSPVDSKQHQVCLCLLKSAYKSYSELHHPNTPHLLSSECQKKLLDDDGYVPMLYSTAPAANADYISMQPRVNHPASLEVHPCSSQQSDKYGYMMMLPGDSSSSRDQAEYDDYMDMSQFSAAEDFAQDSPEGHKTHGSYFSLPRSYKTPSREQREKTEYNVLSPTESHSPHSPGKYIQVDFGEPSPHSAASPPSENSPSPSPPPAQPCHQSCCALPDHSYLGLNMDDLLKDRPPRHSFVAPWNPPNYGRSSGCYSQASTNFEPEKMYSGHRDASSPRRMMQHLCISERLPPGAHAETRVVRADSQGRRRHSSETFAASPGTFAGGCSIKSLDSQKVPETSSWQNSASFDSTWSYPNTSPDSPNLAMNSTAGGTHQNSSSSYLNYIALDLREVPRVPAQAPCSNLQEREGYVSMDFSMSVERATASKD